MGLPYTGSFVRWRFLFLEVDVTEAIVGILFGLTMGWVIAHSTVATECTRLGAFYVGDTTYKCEAVK